MLENRDIEGLDIALTTTDNPYNPRIQWDEWYNYDIVNGYCTLQYIDRYWVLRNSQLPITKQITRNEAILEIAEQNTLGYYKLLTFN